MGRGAKDEMAVSTASNTIHFFMAGFLISVCLMSFYFERN